MILESRNFSFCKEIGILEEKYSRDKALDRLKGKVAAEGSADPAFVKKVQALTLNSPEVSIRACILYNYQANVDYVVSGVIKHTKINNFASSGVHKSIHITEFGDNAKYKTLSVGESIPMSIFNQSNLFTYENMKKALTDAIGDDLPSNYSSYETNGWSVSAYVVPVLTVIMKYGGKEYYLYYNLQNGYYHWEWPNDPALEKKGKQIHTFRVLLTVLGYALNIFAIINGIVTSSDKGGALCVLVPIAAMIANVVLFNKTRKNVRELQRAVLDAPKKSVLPLYIPTFISVAIGIVALIFSF